MYVVTHQGEVSPKRQLDVLLVEDNDADIHLTLVAFRDAATNNHVHVVKDGEEALAFLNRTGDHAKAPRPDIVLLDLNLPKLGGFEVLTQIKADPSLKRIPVIIMSGSDRAIDRIRGYDLQVAGYLIKPPEVDRYFAAVRSVKEMWFHSLALAPKDEDAAAGVKAVG